MQSGPMEAGTENQKQISKPKYKTNSVTNFEHKCAPVFCIHVSFACNQQLAHCRAMMKDSIMQRGALEPRTKYQKQISKKQHKTKSVANFEQINAHSSFASTSALLAISSSHTAGRP